ncbi:MAG: 23S rRNA (adenine(2503)-C(2))-methyltransferase RlmN, partial [Prevotella sp.]|nr:23S rRNA (adenine(2503)-C(2))-methyltransferase RlmN [Prevotella sp.]
DISHAEMLVKLIKNSGVECRVNLIRYHAIDGLDLKPCSEERMLMFRSYLNKNGITATIRASRGEDIEAACGMLAGKNRKQ